MIHQRELRHKMEDAIRLPSTKGKPRGWMRDSAAVYSEGEYNPEVGKYVLSPLRTRPIAQCLLEANFRQDGATILLYYGNVYLMWVSNSCVTIDETLLKDILPSAQKLTSKLQSRMVEKLRQKQVGSLVEIVCRDKKANGIRRA